MSTWKQPMASCCVFSASASRRRDQTRLRKLATHRQIRFSWRYIYYHLFKLWYKPVKFVNDFVELMVLLFPEKYLLKLLLLDACCVYVGCASCTYMKVSGIIEYLGLFRRDVFMFIIWMRCFRCEALERRWLTSWRARCPPTTWRKLSINCTFSCP